MNDPVIGGLIGACVGAASAPAVAVFCERLPKRASLRLPWNVRGQRLPAAPTLITVVAATVTGIRIGATSSLAAFLYLAVVGAALAVIDVRCKRLPNALTYPSYPLIAALFGLALIGTPDLKDALRAVVGGGIFFGVFLLLWLIRPGDLGLGDVKLSGILGIALGWLGWGSWFVGLTTGFLLGGIFSSALLISGRAGLKTRIPYGPFMLGGAFIGVIWGASWATSYLGTPVG